VDDRESTRDLTPRESFVVAAAGRLRLRHLRRPPCSSSGPRGTQIQVLLLTSSGPPSPLHHPSLILLLFLIVSPMFIFLLDLRGRESSRAATAAAECGLFLRKRGLNNSSRSSRRCGLFLPQLNSSLQCCHSSKLKIAAELNCFSLTE